MSVRSIEALLQYLRRLREEAAPPDDAVLLARFVAAKDREAFELLIARHGPMVLGTARRFVQNGHDAEDVFQAVFLSLARLAKSIRQGRALPAWLYKTTCRIAAKFRANRLVQSATPPEQQEHCDPAAGLIWREICQILDEELQRLPERLRSPLLLCYLSGLSRDEAAKQLGWSLGTLKRRLEKGRKILRIRLEKRGIASVGLALGVPTPESLQSAVSTSLRESSLRLIFSTGAAVPATISALALSSAVGMKGLAMKSILVLLAAIAVGAGIYAGTRRAGSVSDGLSVAYASGSSTMEEVKAVQEEKTAQRSVVERILVTADRSKVVTLGQEGDAHIWDGTKAKHLRTLKAAWQRGMAMSPDGRFLIWAITDTSIKFTDPREPRMTFDGSRLRLYDIAADKFVDRFSGFKGDADDLMFTNEGKNLVTVDHRGGMVRIWDVEAGKEERSFQAVPEAEKKQTHHVWRTALAPDGKTLAVGYDPAVAGGREELIHGAPHLVRLWDMASGKEKYTLDGHRDYILDMAFSPDGRLFAACSENNCFVWDAAAGKRVAALPDGLPMGASAVAFSSDGRYLAAALPAGPLRIWEVATWTVRNEFKGHGARPTALTFTPGGLLLSGSVDTTVLAWDLWPPVRSKKITKTRKNENTK